MTGLVRIGVAGMLAAAVSLAVAAGPSDDKIAELIRQLGDPQYGRRERLLPNSTAWAPRPSINCLPQRR